MDANSANARAEGETEMIGAITLRCRGSRAGEGLGFGNTAPTKLEIAVTLNTDITNDRDSSDMIMNKADDAADADGSETSVGYSEGMVVLTALQLGTDQAVTGDEQDDNFSGGAVSDDLRTVTWKVVDQDDPADGLTDELTEFQLAPVGVGDTAAAANAGFELKIMGLRADASGVGHGNDITATVKVNGTTVGSADMKVAGVANGIDPVVHAAKGRECDNGDTYARVTIREGNKNSFVGHDSFLLTFRNIPEGVTVMVPETVGLETDQPGTNINENDGSFIVNLVEGRAGDGVGKPEGGMAMVELSATGTGEVRYTIGNGSRPATAADVTAAANESPPRTIAEGDPVDTGTTVGTSFSGQEWAHVPVTFTWSGGEVVMNADAMVYVSFHPTGGSMIPRFVGDSEADALLTIEDCVTELTFPFVSSAGGYDTGIVVSNTKDAQGSCTASYSGSDDTADSPMIAGNEHWGFLVSSHMQDYTGRLTVKCDFGGIDGYAQINDAMGNTQGYLPRMQ